MAVDILDRPAQVMTTEAGRTKCVHYWVIEPPEGPVSKGVCKRCGAEREFTNYFPHSVWESEKNEEKGIDVDFGFDFDDRGDT